MQFPPLAPAPSPQSSSMHRGTMPSTQDQIAMMDKLRVHTDQYAARSKNSYMAMLDVWTDLEVGDDQQKQELQEVMAKAMDCWASALSELKGRQQAVRDSIQRMLSDIMTIKEEMGSDNPAADADLMRLQVRQGSSKAINHNCGAHSSSKCRRQPGVLPLCGCVAEKKAQHGHCPAHAHPHKPVSGCLRRATAQRTGRCAPGRWMC